VGTAWVLTVRGAGGLPVASITPSSSGTATVAAYYHHDVMGSTVAATEPGVSGAAVVFTYSEFGVPGAGNSTVLSYTYAGYRYDPETGLYYVHARYYNPNLGRFLQTDPIGLSGGTNLYAYVGNDPLNMIDPTGRCAIDIPGANQLPTQQQMSDMGFGNTHPNVVPDPTVPWSVVPVGNPQVYTSQNPLTAGPYQFAGTVYTYQVVNAAGAPITDPMVVNESFSNITLNLNTQAPVAGGWNFPQSGGGTFSDYVGLKTGPSPLASFFSAYAGQGLTLTADSTTKCNGNSGGRWMGWGSIQEA
jgi:RHS repeat-associated protein